MQINSMRKIDFWLGIPVCFIFSILNRIFAVFSFLNKKDKKNILFIQISELGSIILAYPFFKKIEEDYPKKDKFFITFENNAEILRIFGIVPEENILTLSSESFFSFIKDFFCVVKAIRKENIEITFDLEMFSRVSAILSFFSKADKRVGFYNQGKTSLYRGNFLTHRVEFDHKYHVSDLFMAFSSGLEKKNNYCSDVSALDLSNKQKFKYTVSEEDKVNIKNKINGLGLNDLSKIVLIHLGEDIIPLREWPVGNFVELVKKLIAEGYAILLVGSLHAKDKAKLFLERAGNSLIKSLVGQTNMRELLTLFALCNLILTHDSGIAHLASLVDINSVVMFGPETPSLFRPLGDKNNILYKNIDCSPCFSVFKNRESKCKNNLCLKQITVDNVYETVEKILF